MTSISKHNPIWYYSQVVNNAKSEYLTEFFIGFDFARVCDMRPPKICDNTVYRIC